MHPPMMYQDLTTRALIEHAARYHSDTGIVSVGTLGGREYSTWGEVADNARHLASAMHRLDLPAGARCGTLAWNNRRHLEIYFGISSGGWVTHTINPRLSAEHLAFIINDTADEILFFDYTFLPLICALRPQLPTVKHFVLLAPRNDEALAALDALLFFDELVAEADPAYRWPEVSEDSPASLCYTSGTTGKPKGVLNTHRSLVLHTLSGNQPDAAGISAQDTLLPVVPMFHVNAWGTPFIAAMAGARLVLPGPNLDGDSLLRLLSEEQVSVAFGVPVIWAGLLAALRKSDIRLPHFKRSFVGGSALPPSMIEVFRRDYDIALIHAWGMTETSPIGTINTPLSKHKALTQETQEKRGHGQGRVIFGIDLRVVDAQGQTLANDGESQGYLQVRGHWVAANYYGRPDTALTDDGWFDTGDIGTLDENGYLVIHDRAKDIIKSGGEWISTVELENIALAHPAIRSAAAIAAQHPRWDERPVLLCVRAEGGEIEEPELLAWYQARVPKWQLPDRILFIDALPVSATGKVLKNRLRAEFGQILMADGREAG